MRPRRLRRTRSSARLLVRWVDIEIVTPPSLSGLLTYAPADAPPSVGFFPLETASPPSYPQSLGLYVRSSVGLCWRASRCSALRAIAPRVSVSACRGRRWSLIRASAHRTTTLIEIRDAKRYAHFKRMWLLRADGRVRAGDQRVGAEVMWNWMRSMADAILGKAPGEPGRLDNGDAHGDGHRFQRPQRTSQTERQVAEKRVVCRQRRPAATADKEEEEIDATICIGGGRCRRRSGPVGRCARLRLQQSALCQFFWPLGALPIVRSRAPSSYGALSRRERELFRAP